MYCVKCGTQLPDDAQFCFKCGAATGGDGRVAAHQDEWEALEIEARMGDMQWGASLVSNLVFNQNTVSKGHFVARATGGGASYIVMEGTFKVNDYGESIEQFSSINRRLAQQTLDEMDVELKADEWQYVGQGSYWYSHRYRRPFDPQSDYAKVVRSQPLTPVATQRIGKSFWRGKPVPIAPKKMKSHRVRLP